MRKSLMTGRAGAVALALAFATPVAAQIPTAQPEAVVAGVRDCIAAVGPDVVAADRVQELGWRRARAEVNGRPTGMPLPIFSKGHGDPLLLLPPASASGSQTCAIVGRLSGAGAFDQLVATLSTHFTARGRSSGDPVFSTPETLMHLAQTGTRESPGFRIITVPMPATR